MSFRYYVVDIFDGVVRGTNREGLALSFAESEDFYVIDSEANQWLLGTTSSDHVSTEEIAEIEDES